LAPGPVSPGQRTYGSFQHLASLIYSAGSQDPATFFAAAIPGTSSSQLLRKHRLSGNMI
jgi:hypothetical protein